MDPLILFPRELFEKVMLSLTVKDLFSALQVSKQWRKSITENDYLWKCRCSIFENEDIANDLVNKLTWKEIFKKNFSRNKVLKRWKQGQYRKIRKYEELPSKFICKLSVEVWGYLLDIEESYNQHNSNSIKNLF